MLRTMRKDNVRTVRYSLLRFLSITIMVFLSVAFFIGLKFAGPSMLYTAENFANNYNMPDGKVMYPGGITEEILKDIEHKSSIKVLGIHSTDVNSPTVGQSIHLYANENQLGDMFSVKLGQLPSGSMEIALDIQVKESYPELEIGDFVEIENIDSNVFEIPKAKVGQYKIVGFIESPLYLSNLDRGIQMDGQGSVAAFGLVSSGHIDCSEYSEAFYWAPEMKVFGHFSDDYDQALRDKVTDIDKNLGDIAETLHNQVIEQQLKDISEQQVELELALSRRLISQEDVHEKETALKQMSQALEAYPMAQFQHTSRLDFSGYRLLKNNAMKMDEISKVFPVFFFLLSIVVTFITMTRMAQDEQKYIGTMKQMGYSNYHVMEKFIFYAFSSVSIGIILGIVVGTLVIPGLVINAYMTLHPLSEPRVQLDGMFIAIVSIASLIIALIPAVITPLKLVRKPAIELLQENLEGSSKSSRSQKSSRLNYICLWVSRSIRMAPTRSLLIILALAASVMLMVAGFGLSDSLTGTVARQFNEITHYTSIIYVDSNGSQSDYSKAMDQIEHLEGSFPVSLTQAEVKSGTNQGLKFQILVPMGEEEGLVNMLELIDDEKRAISIEEGIIATPVLGQSGESIEVTLNDLDYALEVDAIAQNYVGNYLYMSPETYSDSIDQKPMYNAFLVKYDMKHKDQIEEDMLAVAGIKSIMNLEQLKETAEESMESLNMITIILIIASAGLTFIILLNLMNIILMENYRELAIMKTLGLFDCQVSWLIFLEAFILATIGIAIGSYLGQQLNLYIVNLLSRDDLVFHPEIDTMSYVYSIILAYLFILVVSLLVHNNVRKINKVEAMKDTN
ncbi:hypothetical protein CL176_10760 [Suicoccus acidiformans]|uniref:ABC3 transporter permease C-terminal domain-containing protein n=1 Tax=Suicoccus acidiformans TaxID=2036206 RepID=A0A347WMX7_9LACT|nr:ABC transporter permease [Suicoccus acidiformans]AXY26434.1 hypothetical protein CL176_10760 [Suicoccus acidiformans]